MSDTLTAKQLRFVQEYAIDANATQAAIRAGYSPKTAQEQSSRLLSNVMVHAELSTLQAEIASRLDLTAEAVLAGVMRTTLEAREAKEFSAALRGYELLGKHLKLWTDRVEATGKDGNKLEVLVRRVGVDV